MNEKILIVDDDSSIRQLYGKILKMEGFQVIEAKSAEEATEILLRSSVDLILLDINMPDVNGIVMRDVLNEYDKKMKIIVASVYPVNFQQRWVKQVTDYFDKSRGVDVLLEKVRRVFEMGATKSISNHSF